MRRKISLIVLTFGFFLNSCIYEEFRPGNSHLSDDWKMEVISPLFYGNWSLYDLLLEKQFFGTDIPYISFSAENDSIFNISESSLIELTPVIDSFNFYIDGDDYLESAAMIFEVQNESELDFIIQLRFYQKLFRDKPDFSIKPSPFEFNQTNQDTVNLSTEQIDIFKAADRVEFSISFRIPETDMSKPVNTNTKINFSVILIGKLHGKYE